MRIDAGSLDVDDIISDLNDMSVEKPKPTPTK